MRAIGINSLGDDEATLEIRDAADLLIGRIKLTETGVGAVALASGTGRGDTVVALTYSGIELEDIGTSASVQITINGPQQITPAFVADISKYAQVHTGSANSVELTLQPVGQEAVTFAIDGFELDYYRAPSDTLSPLIVQFSSKPGFEQLANLMSSFGRDEEFESATITVKNDDGVLLQAILLELPRITGQSLGAGGKGMDTALAFLFDKIDLTSAATAGAEETNYVVDDPSFTGGRAALTALATVVGGSDFTYTLVYDGHEVELSGYELDLLQPFTAGGDPGGAREARSLILHVDQSAGNVHLIDLLSRAASNLPTDEGTVVVRNGDGAIVNKVVLTNFSVSGAALADAASSGEAVVALNYEKLDFQIWDPSDPAATLPTHNAEFNVNAGSEPGLTALVSVPYAELAAEANAGTPGWVERLIDEVQDFFQFVRSDLPQRALGLVTPADSMSLLAGDSASFAAGDLPSLSDVPIIGDKLIPLVENGLDIFRDVEARIIEALNNLPDEGDAAEALADKLNELGIAGLEAQADGTSVRVSFTAEDAVDLALDNLKVSIGTDLFGLDLDADLAARIKAALNIAVMVDVATGAIEIVDNAADEMTLALTAGADFEANAGLGVIDITATDNDPAPTEVNLTFGLNVDGGRVEDIELEDIDLSMDGSARLDLHVVTATPVSLLPTIAGDFVVNWSFAGAGESLLREVAFNNVTLDLRSLLQTLSEVFEPIADIYEEYGIGTFLDAITQPLPVIDTLARKIGATSFLDFVPIETGDGTLNLLDVAVLVLKAQGAEDDDPRITGIVKFAEALAAIDSAIADGGLGDDLGLIELGSFSFIEPAGSLRGFASMAADSPGIVQTEDRGDPMEQANNKISGSDEFKDGVDGREGLSVFGESPFADGFRDISGFSMPILEDRTAALKILFSAAFPDEPVDIIQYDLPAIEFAGYYERFFPIVGPIGAVLAGGFDGRIDFAIGYDSSGLARGGLSDFEKGFYVTTQEFVNGSGVFEPIATIDVGIGAGAAINVGVASAGVIGSIVSTISAFLNDSDMDGKLYFADFDECLVNPLTGKFTAELSAFLKVGWGPFSWTRRFKIADATLADFSFGCDGPDASEMGGLATLGPATNVPAETLQLNVGSRANLRHSIVPEYTIDDDEHYAIRNAIDDNGQLIAGALQVGGFTQIETFGGAGAPITIIKASFGADDDSLVIEQDVLTPSDIAGDAGNDLLYGGGGNDILWGDDRNNNQTGEDILVGGKGNDTLYGGKGEDTLDGGAGADYIDGGADMDQVTFEESPTAVIFRPIAPINGQPAFGGQGGDAEGDILVSIEYIIGSRFSDQLYGNPNAENILEGIEGNDILSGGSKQDYIIGGPGADMMFGLGNLEDGTSYVTSNGGVRVDLATGIGRGADAEGDRLSGIEFMQGSAFDDALRGSSVANRLDGFYGDDVIEGRGGADFVDAGAGDDIVYALADGDRLDGGYGRDLLSYVNRSTSGVTVNLKTGDGGGSDQVFLEAAPGLTNTSSFEDLDGTDIAASGDSLTGDIANNRIRGFAGNDQLFGDQGDDVLEGGAGADLLSGGDGRDLADYRSSTGSVGVSLESRTGVGAHAQGDTFDVIAATTIATIEDLRGSDFADILIGSEVANRLDPGLSRGSPGGQDIVAGRIGIDTIVIDYSRGDQGEGMVGGYNLGSAFEGIFARRPDANGVILDRVTFGQIEKLEVIGTFGNDFIAGGGGDDLIITESGNDTIYGGGKGVFPIEGPQRLGTAVGADRILAGSGDDIVFYGTNENRVLARDIISETFDGVFAPFLLDGGRGIDTLSISLVHFGTDIKLEGAAPGEEYQDVNLSLYNGGYAANFEILGSVYTGAGNDTLRQDGFYNNVFETNGGQDVITPGLGNDSVHGGHDFSSNFDGGYFIDFEQNWGDLLILDFSTLQDEAGVYGQVDSMLSDLNNTDFRLINFRTNAGSYSSNLGKMDFEEIERLHVTGTDKDDQLVGTDNWAQNRFSPQGLPVPSADSNRTKRGADELYGGAGHDTLIGNNGSDLLDGGEGNDVLIGADPYAEFLYIQGRVYNDNYIDQTEIDTLTGGNGADRFVLGTSDGLYYGYTRPDFSRDGSGDQNRAIITDFNIEDGDQLQLYGSASLYSTTVVGDSLRLYLNESNGGRQWIAELEGVTSLNLNGPNVVYGGTAAFSTASAPAAAALDAPAAITAAPETESFSLEPAAPPASLDAGDWITQNCNPTSLRDKLLQALTGTGINTASLTVEIDGHAEGFGTFEGDPFGLGSGIILSTGKVVDLQGANTEDGRLAQERVVEIQFVKIGRTGDDPVTGQLGSDIFRADLTGLGFDLSSITLPDSNSRTGGAAGHFSGFDLDSIMLSRTLIGPFADNAIDINNPSSLPTLDVFDFSAGGIVFVPGTQRGGSFYELNGLRNGIITDPGHFAVRDGRPNPDGIRTDGHNALGDGGVISFNLTDSVDTDAPLYLYIAEQGGVGETVSGTIRASDQRIGAVSDLSTDFGEPGAKHDTTKMTFSFDKLAGSTDNLIIFNFVMFTEELTEFAGSEFNDIVKITLNGENLAQLTDGYALTVNNLMASPLGPFHPDLILNPAGSGPLADEIRADAYTKTLTFAGNLQQRNTITIEVRDNGDGTLDSGVLLKAGTAATGGGWTTLDFNDAPYFSDLDGAATFNEGGAAVVMDANATVFDPELAALGNYAGASLTLSRLGGPDARDSFGASGPLGFSGGNVIVSGTNIGTVSQSGGTLQVLFNGNATQALVNSLLSALTYAHSAPGADEDLVFLWRFSDGNSGAQGLGGALEAVGATTVRVEAENQGPTARNDAVSVNEDATTANLVGLLLSNDTDPDLDPLRILSVDGTGLLGTLSFDAATQTLTYSADNPSFDALEPGETANTVFTYTVQDPTGATSSASVAVTIAGLLNDDDYIYGTPNNDTMTGSAANEKFRSLAGNDIVYGEGGNDRIEAGPGNDILYGGTGSNLLFGEAGNDTFGNETIAAVNLFDGGEGVDTLITRALAAPARTLTPIASTFGRSSGEGHERMTIDTYLDGQSDYAGPMELAIDLPVTVDLTAGTVTGGYADGSTVVGIENVRNGSPDTAVTYIGDGAANALTGGNLADVLRGGGGADTLQGGAGADLIDGGADADMLGGGAGNDTFVLRRGETQGDRLLDFIGNGAAAGDAIRFEGFGPGAFLTSSGTTFTIHHAAGTETFMMNTPQLHPTDYVFV